MFWENTHTPRKEIRNSFLLLLMTPGNDLLRKSDSESVMEPGEDKQGIDFLQVLQVGGGLIIAVALVYLLLHNVLYMI